MVDEIESKLSEVFNSCNNDICKIYCNTCTYISNLESFDEPENNEKRNNHYSKLGQNFWDNALKEENFYKLFFAYVVVWRMELNLEILKRNSNADYLETNSIKAASKVNFKLNSVDTTRQYGRNISDEYLLACNSSNQLTCLNFFENVLNDQYIYNPGGYDFEILSFMIKFIHFLHIDGIKTLFERNEPLITELVINSLTKELLLNYFVKHAGLHEYASVRFFYHYVKQFARNYDPTSDISIPFSKLKVIIQKLQNLSYWVIYTKNI